MTSAPSFRGMPRGHHCSARDRVDSERDLSASPVSYDLHSFAAASQLVTHPTVAPNNVTTSMWVWIQVLSQLLYRLPFQNFCDNPSSCSGSNLYPKCCTNFCPRNSVTIRHLAPASCSSRCLPSPTDNLHIDSPPINELPPPCVDLDCSQGHSGITNCRAARSLAGSSKNLCSNRLSTSLRHPSCQRDPTLCPSILCNIDRCVCVCVLRCVVPCCGVCPFLCFCSCLCLCQACLSPCLCLVCPCLCPCQDIHLFGGFACIRCLFRHFLPCVQRFHTMDNSLVLCDLDCPGLVFLRANSTFSIFFTNFGPCVVPALLINRL